MTRRLRVTSGVGQLDRLLGGLFVGDNVVWLDDSGSLASAFCLNFVQSSLSQNKPLVYVGFDRSPRSLLEKLGPMAANPALTILDCFTCGKGASSPFFLRFYEEPAESFPCHIVKVKDPRSSDEVMEVLYGEHGCLRGDDRLVFESLTGMQELWGGEESVLKFYSRSCPRLYDLNTVAYWIMEKRAHSPRLRARISQIAQVVVELSIKRGTSSLAILKAEKRDLEILQKPISYWAKDLTITFDEQKRPRRGIDLGLRIRELRSRKGLSQTEMAKLVGVTASTISQVESNHIYPSLPALLKMAEVLSVDVSSLFQDKVAGRKRFVFPASESVTVKDPGLPDESLVSRLLTPIDSDFKAEPYLIEIPAQKTISSHFFVHKGEEMGYLLSGELQIRMEGEVHTLHPGDLVYLDSGVPTQWKNAAASPAKILWIKVKA